MYFLLLFVSFLSAASCSLRYWEIQRGNGFVETCCFCSLLSLKTKEHVIKECEDKFGKVGSYRYNFTNEYHGPPICSCFSSRKYPRCPEEVKICGRNVYCKNRRVYNECRTAEFKDLTLRCNDSLQWDFSIQCPETCQSTFKIRSGIVHCPGNQTMCHVQCEKGFKPNETNQFLSCEKAKTIVCFSEIQPVLMNESNMIHKIILPLILTFLFLILIGICLYRRCIAAKNTGDEFMLQPINNPDAEDEHLPQPNNNPVTEDEDLPQPNNNPVSEYQHLLPPINNPVTEYQHLLPPINNPVTEYQHLLPPINNPVTEYQHLLPPINNPVTEYQHLLPPINNPVTGTGGDLYGTEENSLEAASFPHSQENNDSAYETPPKTYEETESLNPDASIGTDQRRQSDFIPYSQEETECPNPDASIGTDQKRHSSMEQIPVNSSLVDSILVKNNQRQ